MSLSCGLVGLPNAGKSTIFNALTNAGAQVAGYPFCTVEPNIGVVPVPDPNLEKLAAIAGTTKLVPARVKFVDIAGLVKGASRGDGLGNQFLGHIQEVDAIIHVARAFQADDVPHVDGSISPLKDIEVVNTELLYRDLATVENRFKKAERNKKSGSKEAIREYQFLSRLFTALDGGTFAREFAVKEDEQEIFDSLFLLTAKPVLYVINTSGENSGTAEILEKLRSFGDMVITIDGKTEEELADLSEDERREFMEVLELEEDGRTRLISASFKLLRLITFYTITGGKEVRAWPIRQGSNARTAAGKIHTDMERGFIRAEVIPCDKLCAVGSLTKARENGLVRVEGHDYIVEDGDVIHFRFNV